MTETERQKILLTKCSYCLALINRLTIVFKQPFYALSCINCKVIKNV